MRVVSMSEYFAARRELGAVVELLYIATAWKQKRTAANVRTRRAMRFTIAHLNDGSPRASNFAANADAQSICLLAQPFPRPDSVSATSRGRTTAAHAYRSQKGRRRSAAAFRLGGQNSTASRQTAPSKSE